MKLQELHEAMKADKSVADLDKKYVRGSFGCDSLELTSLVGCPKKVLEDFDCDDNLLTSLNGAPKEVGGSFFCDGNQLTSLVGAPNKVGRHFSAENNKLTSLKGAPKEIGENFYCCNNKHLASFAGIPTIINGDLYAYACFANSLEGMITEIGGSVYLHKNNLTSLEGIHLAIKSIGQTADFCQNPIKSHVLGLLLIDGLKSIEIDNKEVQKIINKYLKGSRDVIDCQNELMDAGLDEYAQL